MTRRGSSALVAAALLAAASPTAVSGQAAARSDEDARVAAIERVKPSIVYVTATAPPSPPSPPPSGRKGRSRSPVVDFPFPRQGPNQAGTGFVIDRAREMVLTPAHIVPDGHDLTVRLPDGGARPATRHAIDRDLGVAILRVPGLGLPALVFSARRPKAGEATLVVGWMIPARAILATDGMVMGDAGEIATTRAEAPALADYVAIDNPLPNGGFGGSPVVDRSGEVVGFVSAILGPSYGRDAITLMIPAAGLRPLLDQLVAERAVRRSTIGAEIECHPMPCSVLSVTAGGPAEAAGLRPQDGILSVNGAQMVRPGLLARTIAAAAVGSDLALGVIRDGQSLTVRVRTEATPPPAGEN